MDSAGLGRTAHAHPGLGTTINWDHLEVIIAPEDHEAHGRAHTATVLLVDDDPMVLLLAGDVLREDGAQVHEASTLSEARAALATLEPDLIVLDLLLPDGHGLQLCEQLRADAQTAHLPVLVLTASEDDQVVRAAFDAGATDFLRKPIEPALLSHRVRFGVRASRALHALESSRTSLAEAHRMARLGTFRIEGPDRTVHVSAELAAIVGRPPEPLVGHIDALAQIIHPEDRTHVLQGLADAAADVSRIEHEVTFRYVRGPGPQRWMQLRLLFSRDNHGEVRSTLGTVQDITERRQREQAIDYLANHDQLTGLLNQSGFERITAAALKQASDQGSSLAVLHVDVVSASRLPALLGPERTAQLLRQAGDRLAATGRADASSLERSAPLALARWSESSFMLLYPDIASVADALALAHAAVDALRPSFDVDEQLVQFEPRVGVALYPDDGQDVATLERHAEVAMLGGEDTRSPVQRFEPRMRQEAELRSQLEQDLGRALEREELSLHFQPQVTPDGRVVAVEALLRWTHPTHGPIPPDRFIPIAERTGLIDPIGAWVIDEGLACLAALRREGASDLHLGVNLSAVQLDDPGLVSRLVDALARHELPAPAVTLELTESTQLGVAGDVATTIQALKATGVGLGLDDFGTGYSSLDTVARLPLDELKIDRAFVWQLDHAGTRAVVRATIALAQGLSLRLVAEGVETAEQQDWLVREGCDRLQGYRFGRPMPYEQVRDLLVRSSSGTGHAATSDHRTAP